MRSVAPDPFRVLHASLLLGRAVEVDQLHTPPLQFWAGGQQKPEQRPPWSQ
jgi:hypothetical protein